MKPNTTVAALAALAGLVLAAAVSAPAAASDIAVDVRVASGTSPYDGSGCDRDAWIEFTPERSAFVAIYATFSDGSLRPVFPVGYEASHWVNAYEVHTISVRVPAGLRLETVQAVASPDWFDPGTCWIATAPGPRCDHGWADCAACGPRVVVTAAWDFPGSVWSFAVAWHGESHRYRVVRSWGWGCHAGAGWAWAPAARWTWDGHGHGHRGHGHGHHDVWDRDDRDDRHDRSDRHDGRDRRDLSDRRERRDPEVRVVKDVRAPVKKTVVAATAAAPVVRRVAATPKTKSAPSVRESPKGKAAPSGSTKSKSGSSSRSGATKSGTTKKVRG